MTFQSSMLLPMLLLLATPVAAQPAQNGNVYNGLAHQPTAGGVSASERAAGVAPSKQQVQQEDHDLNVMGRNLTERANQDAAHSPGMPRPPSASGQ